MIELLLHLAPSPTNVIADNRYRGGVGSGCTKGLCGRGRQFHSAPQAVEQRMSTRRRVRVSKPCHLRIRDLGTARHTNLKASVRAPRPRLTICPAVMAEKDEAGEHDVAPVNAPSRCVTATFRRPSMTSSTDRATSWSNSWPCLSCEAHLSRCHHPDKDQPADGSELHRQ